MRGPGPVRPRRQDDRRFYRHIARAAVVPMYESLFANIVETTTHRQLLATLEGDELQAIHRPGFVSGIASYMIGLERDHQNIMARKFWNALRMDIRPVLDERPVRAFVRQRIDDSVNLIKSMGDRGRERMRSFLHGEMERGKPFNRQRIATEALRQSRVTSRHARLIARDQTTKAIGGLSQIRQQQAGVKRYRWSTSRDERVRPSHVAMEGQVVQWDSPPLDIGHPGWDIQCRCVAVPVIEG